MEKALSIKNVSVYYGKNPALKDICLDIDDGEFLGIIGPNGGGKSTLLKSILGLMPLTNGTVKIYGGDLNENKSQIGYVPQFSNFDKHFPITVIDVVLTGLLDKRIIPFFRFKKEDTKKAYTLLERVGISDLAKRKISDLSGGEFQKMLIARALAVNPKLLLLDEPTASVDASSRDQIYKLLAELNKDMTVLLVTHDLFAISNQVRKLACLNEKLIYHGEPELNEKIVNSLYSCPVDLIAHGVPHRVLKDHKEGK